jgi:protein PhnA
MKLEDTINNRSGGACELCNAKAALSLYEVSHAKYRDEESCLMLCETCQLQVEKKAELDSIHWRFLSDAIWSELPGVQVIAWRILNRLRSESWASDALDLMYLDEDRIIWAKAAGDHENDHEVLLHRDSNGAQLFDGDTVVLTKSLDVKGSTINARVGTVVRNIRIVKDNTEQVEGRIENQLIVILTKYLRKQHA